MPTAYRPGRFVIDGLDGAFDGFTSGTLWNGWATPLFERYTAARIADAFAAQTSLDGDFLTRYDADADAFVLQDPADEEPFAYAATSIEVDGHEVAVYPIGTHVWTWEEPDAPREALPPPRPVTLHLVFEADTDPLTGEVLPREEETVTVEAPTPELAARRAMLHARTNPRGRLVRYATADGTPVYAA